ncbi:aldo/keto reductase [Niabella yanshanensis]|uniref:Aldo/keto reductase n=1 Tax=Niabella yanshanensis TaxID=577386 RepID=A0ABZ0W255_9BACT|nr:aldo/keto reductase [Niabella yanshanensis]WQD36999.1 aldo/keto reductase [Niabella yanshanensis]
MNYRPVGKSGLSVSETGFGCMSLAKAPDAEATAIVHTAVDAGINYFDTADLYDKGANEELIGKLLKPVRSKIVLATKVGNRWKDDGSGWDWNPTKDYILKAVDESLRRLQTDYIDLYQLHGGTMDDPIDETIEAFEQLVQQGKIRHYGISSIRPNVIRAYTEESNIISVMLQYSLLDRRPEETVLDLLKTNGMGVMVRGALAQGLLAGKAPKEYLGHPVSTVQSAAGQVKKQATASGTTPSAWATQYVLNNPAVSSVVTGISTMEQLLEAIAPRPQPDAAWFDELERSVPASQYREHR